jgi:hypothetical protein
VNKKILGLVVSPGEAEKKVNTLIDMIPCALKEVSQNTEEWQVQTIVDSLTGSAESINEIFQKINAHTKKMLGTLPLESQTYQYFMKAK